MHDDHNLEGNEDAEFNDGFPNSRNEVQNSARGFENQKCEPEMAENTESASSAAAIYFQLRFDFGFKDI